MPRPGPPVSSGVSTSPVVVPGDRELLEAQVALVEQAAVGVDRIDDHELRAVEADVALQQRQHAAADRAEADHDDRAGEVAHAGRGSRSCESVRSCRSLPGTGGEWVRPLRHGAALPRARATSVDSAGVGLRGPVGRRSGRARRRARPAQARRRAGGARSYGPGSQSAPVASAEKPKRRVVRRVADQQDGARAPRRSASRSAWRISALPMPRWRHSPATASGPSSSAGRPRPAVTCHSRTVPTTRPFSVATNDRPSAGSTAFAQALGGLAKRAAP